MRPVPVMHVTFTFRETGCFSCAGVVLLLFIAGVVLLLFSGLEKHLRIIFCFVR